MFKTILAVTCCLGVFNVSAQVDLQFPDSQAVWIQGFVNDYPVIWNYSVQQYEFGTDTSVGIENYHSLMRNDQFSTLYAGAIRKDSQERVYFVPPDSSKEFLLYDFSAQVGDTLTVWSSAFTCYGINEVIVAQTDVVNDDGTDFFRFLLSTPQFGPNGVWIKGVGSEGGLLESYYTPSVSGITFLQCLTVNSIPIYPGNGQNCYYVGEQSLPQVENIISLSPNPFNTMFELSQPNSMKYAALIVYDASGKKTLEEKILSAKEAFDMSRFANGIYFVKLIGNNDVSFQKLLKGN